MSVAHVVHLLQEWGPETPPENLRLSGAMKASARALFAALLVIESLATCFFVWVLWTEETPGWWFSLLFTVILLGMSVALWAVYVSAIGTGRERALAQARWTASLGSVRLTAGTVAARDVSTIEDGSVSRFELAVDADDSLLATWQRRTSSARMLLQTQVPGVGAPVRVWRSPGAPADFPLVIEALDPSVVPGSTRLDKYAG
jgi:hypothetical protein